MIDGYDAPTGREAMLRFGPDDGPVVVPALPLFEEANRTRAFVVTILRELARRGIAGALPDLPGQGESPVPTHAVALLDIREGHEAAVSRLAGAGREVYAIGVRSGALLDAFSLCSGRWHLAAQDGPSLLRELARIRQAADGRPPGDDAVPVEIAGNLISPDLLQELPAAILVEGSPDLPVRTVRLEGDPRPADRIVPGSPPWRRAEPGNDPTLAALLADDIAGWVRACAG